jgi:hypothetical protein
MWETNELKISADRYQQVESGEEFFIRLVTSDITITFTNSKPIGQLEPDEALFKYTLDARLVAQTLSGEVVFDRLISDPSKEQVIVKAIFFLNPVFKAKMGLYKNNADKLKELTDKWLNKKSNLVLAELLGKASEVLADQFERQSKRDIFGLFSVKGKGFADIETTRDNVVSGYSKFTALSKKNRITKDAFDQIIKDAIVIWGKSIAEKSSAMEDKAIKGIRLNCALGYAWLGDLEKATSYIDLVPEAKALVVEEDSDETDPEMGSNVILALPSYAINVKQFIVTYKEKKDRLQFSQ